MNLPTIEELSTCNYTERARKESINEALRDINNSLSKTLVNNCSNCTYEIKGRTFTSTTFEYGTFKTVKKLGVEFFHELITVELDGTNWYLEEILLSEFTLSITIKAR